MNFIIPICNVNGLYIEILHEERVRILEKVVVVGWVNCIMKDFIIRGCCNCLGNEEDGEDGGAGLCGRLCVSANMCSRPNNMNNFVNLTIFHEH